MSALGYVVRRRYACGTCETQVVVVDGEEREVLCEGVPKEGPHSGEEHGPMVLLGAVVE